MNENKRVFSFDCRFDEKDQPVLTFPIGLELPEPQLEGQEGQEVEQEEDTGKTDYKIIPLKV